MDQDLAQPDDLIARRDAMRERLRTKAERVLEAVEEIGDPKSFIEVERAARAILVVDRMIMQVFSAPRHKSFGLTYDGGEPGRGYASRMPVENRGDGLDDRAVDAPIVAFGDTSPLRCAKGEDEKAESAHTDGVENSFKDEVAFAFDPEKEAHANAIYAAYCEFKRLEREAEERFGLGP